MQVAKEVQCRFQRWGVAKLVKAADFDSAIRGFESFLPSHSSKRRNQRGTESMPRFR